MENGKDNHLIMINRPEDWADYEDEFRRSIGQLGVIGLDCEWVEPDQFDSKERRDMLRNGQASRPSDQERDELRKKNASSGKVALLQMASHGGMVVLIRLCFFTKVPSSLKSLLEDGKILKLGVNIEIDAKKLFVDWQVNMAGFVDLRNIVVRSPRFLDDYHKSGLGLKKLANFLTGIQCNEGFNDVRFSHWAANELSHEQIQYASDDARMALQGYVVFTTKYLDDLPDPASGQPYYDFLRKQLLHHVNRVCSDYVTLMFNKTNATTNEDKAAMRKCQERRQRLIDRDGGMNDSDSEIEIDYDAWRKSSRSKRLQMKEGIDRAVVFYDEKQRGLAAIDSALLQELEGVDEPQDLVFDVRSKHGASVYQVKVNLKKVAK